MDRLWPRGINKSQLTIDGWYKEIAPSNELRTWFHNNPKKWKEFMRQYFAELDKVQAWKPLLELATRGDITLIYAAKDEHHNNAVALKAYFDAKLKE